MYRVRGHIPGGSSAHPYSNIVRSFPEIALGLLLITTFIESSRVFTIPSIQPLLRLMLADTPSPHGSGASRVTVGTVSAGSVRVVTFPHICVGYC